MPKRPNHLVRNMLALLALECCWSLGIWMANPFTVVPNFLMRFGASPTVIGLLPAMWGIGMAFGAVTAASMVAGRRKLAKFIGAWHYVAVIPYLGLGLLAMASSRWDIPGWAGQALTIGLICSFNIVMGPLFQIYFVLLTRILPERGRGRLFGAVFAAATFIGLAGPLIAGSLLAGGNAPMPVYAKIFLGAFAVFCVGNASFFLMEERPTTPHPPRRIPDNIRAITKIWRDNSRLRQYLVARKVIVSGAAVF